MYNILTIIDILSIYTVHVCIFINPFPHRLDKTRPFVLYSVLTAANFTCQGRAASTWERVNNNKIEKYTSMHERFIQVLLTVVNNTNSVIRYHY